MPELLIELLSEEIPARMQARAAEDLKRLVVEGLGLAHVTAEAFATPRRLALVVRGLPARQPDRTTEVKGPRVGAPDKAIQGFLKSRGLASLDLCRRVADGKGESYVFDEVAKGVPTADLVGRVLERGLADFPWPKAMRWGSGTARWVRPLQGIVCLFDGKVVPVSFAGIEAGDATRGHRFLTPFPAAGNPPPPPPPTPSREGRGGATLPLPSREGLTVPPLPLREGVGGRGSSDTANAGRVPGPIIVAGFDDYRRKLRGAKVMLDASERRKVISRECEEIARRAGCRVVDDESLLTENAGLVEWPVVLEGRIDDRFLDLPQEVLVTSMRTHQKYFAMIGQDMRLANRFVLVANTVTADGGKAVVAGNERVLRARLSDARFFWDGDRRRTLESRVGDLDAIVFHAKLGTLGAKVDRVERLAVEIAQYVPDCDVAVARRAARLAKADLTTGMVGEFPELQGIMGRYYAGFDGEPVAVAQAIAEHYAPQGPANTCPHAPASVAVALADKIDTLVGFFAIDAKPTGSKDPFALRRAALGVIRLILENGLRISLRDVFVSGAALYAPVVETSADAVAKELLDFFADRLKVHLRDSGVRHDAISAVFAKGDDDLVRVVARARALQGFLAGADGENLLVAYRRAGNIVRIEEKRDGRGYDGASDPGKFVLPEEVALKASLGMVAEQTAKALDDEAFEAAMGTMASLRAPVDAFFDRVTVNAEDRDLRENRLRLLAEIRATLDAIADFSKIEG